MKTGKPVWRVIAEPYKVTDKSTGKSSVGKCRFYNVIAPEMEITARGERSNEYNVRGVCQEKGFNIIGCIFMGYTNMPPKGAFDISTIVKEDIDTDKKVDKFAKNKKSFVKRNKTVRK